MVALRTLLNNPCHILSPAAIRVSPKLVLCDMSGRICKAKIPSKSRRHKYFHNLPHFVYVQRPGSGLNNWSSFHDVIRP